MVKKPHRLEIKHLAVKVALSRKVKEIEGKIPDITSLANKAALNTKSTVIEGKIPETATFLSKTRFNFIIKDVD